MSPTVQRVVAAAVLLVLGILSLPLVASVLDGESTENWIIPVQLVLMALIGIGVTSALPAIVPAGSEVVRRVTVGVAWGLLAALVGLIVFWLLLNGFDGA